MKWNFQTRLERFEVGTNEHAWQHIVIPENMSKEIQQSGHTRFVLTLNGHTSWHCAVNVTCEADHQEAGISFVYVAKQHMRDAKCEPAAWVDVLLEVDNSKYGMDVHPALQAMLDDDPLFQKRFDAMLPGKRRGHLLQVNKAKSPGTVAKRIAALMNELKLT